MNVPILDLKAQFKSIEPDVMAAVNEICQSQMLCLGPAVEQFEKEIADYCGCRYALGVSSGSDALLLSLMAMNVGPGDEIITTPFTFFATAGAIARTGAKPVFADVDPDNFNIDPAKIKEKITEQTKGIIPVHLFGQIAPMKPIMDIAQKNNLFVIEDACQAIGATQRDIKAGNFGQFGCFSFYPTKNLGAFGDSGLVTCNDDELAAKAKMLRTHGESKRYYYQSVGGNFRMDGIQGAVLSVKLRYLDNWTRRRRENAKRYDELLNDSPVQTPQIDTDNVSIYHQYTIKAPRRDELQKHLSEKQISSAVFYPEPLHLQACFKDLGYAQGDFPVTEQLCKEVLSLPVYPELTDAQINYVAESILNFYQ